MKPRRLGSLVGSVFSVPMAVALVVLFFLPWLGVSCQGPNGEIKIGTATGLELAGGELTSDPQLQQMFGESPETKEDDAESPNARPWAYLGLAIPMMVILAGMAGLSGRLGAAVLGVLLVLLAGAGVGVMAAAAHVTYPELEADNSPPAVEQSPPWSAGSEPRSLEAIQAEAMAEAFAAMGQMMASSIRFNVEVRPALWWSLGLYISVGLLGLGVAVAGLAGRQASPTPRM